MGWCINTPMFRDTHHAKPCKYCTRPMDRASAQLQATRDHFNPRSKGGGPVVICCITCNSIKGDMNPEDWLQFMAEYPRWWKLTKLQLRDIRRKLLGLPSRRQKLCHFHFAKAQKQGTARTPVIVPAHLIFPRGPAS